MRRDRRGGREIGYLFGQYKRITNRHESGVLTGKGLDWGGSLVRKEATGYGAVYFLREMLKVRNQSLDGRSCLVSASGNVAICTIEKLHALGAKVVACSDSNGVIVHEAGIDLPLVKQLKEVERRRIADYAGFHKDARYIGGGSSCTVRKSTPFITRRLAKAWPDVMPPERLDARLAEGGQGDAVM